MFHKSIEKNPKEIKDSVDYGRLLANSFFGEDTTNITNEYVENSFNIRIKYPNDWVFVDQHKDNKFEGVVFFFNSFVDDFGNTPFISLYLKDKNYFSSESYSYKSSTDYYTIYFNDPYVMGNKKIFELYLRTNEDFDFLFKLQANDDNEFDFYKMKFLYMLKTFKFSKGLIK